MKVPMAPSGRRSNGGVGEWGGGVGAEWGGGCMHLQLLCVILFAATCRSRKTRIASLTWTSSQVPCQVRGAVLALQRIRVLGLAYLVCLATKVPTKPMAQKVLCYRVPP